MNRTNRFSHIIFPRTGQVVTLNEGLIQPLPQTWPDDGYLNHLLVKTRMYSAAKPLILIIKPFAEMCSQLTANNGVKEEGWPVLLGSLLHKKDDRETLRNYRLLAILDSDLR